MLRRLFSLQDLNDMDVCLCINYFFHTSIKQAIRILKTISIIANRLVQTHMREVFQVK